ncbi:CpaF family protein [Marinivivus vitaminiproducens]|uniref:CpaF family protein n=1 Tax=Marinivivus vitaminiproducens TaxID=3035935 RepID=UPI00279F6B69|nr:CpaF family protein [Geminicoccaceae bacterium SCSIO 64248]
MAAPATVEGDAGLEGVARLRAWVRERVRAAGRRPAGRREMLVLVGDLLLAAQDETGITLGLVEQRRLVGELTDDPTLLASPDTPTSALPGRAAPDAASAAAAAIPTVAHEADSAGAGTDDTLERVKRQIRPLVLERIEVGIASTLPPELLVREIDGVVGELRAELKLPINRREQTALVQSLVDDMIGHGPLEVLLGDETVTDIMVNGPHQIYVERRGKIELTQVRFQDNEHLMNVAQRIVAKVGRRVDETSPVCDARLPDGSRVNIIAMPLAIDGCSMSIRKFPKHRIDIDQMVRQGNLSEPMGQLLKIASRSRLNTIISGGTGSGKTTLLNALSRQIDNGERIVTIEDAAELRLQQPHVVRLETRPANLEGKGEVSIRDLVKNALRMRPDRIILGEVRGAEAFDMLQAMNTGHEGSMGTLHANKPRDALVRLENMVSMGVSNLPQRAIRQQIASSVDLIVQISRMRDGVRRIQNIVEVVGMEGDVIVTQELFHFGFTGVDERGRLKGEFKSSGLRPHFMPKAEMFGLDQALLALI